MESKLLNNVESISNDELIGFIKKANQAYFNKSNRYGNIRLDKDDDPMADYEEYANVELEI